MLMSMGAKSGCGVMTRTTLQVAGSRPGAITRRTTSLLVKIPVIAPWSWTKTAVVWFSFICWAASLTDVRTLTVVGGRPLSTDSSVGPDILVRSASTYWMICCGWLVPSSDCTPSSAS
jgi:hypothetical protein